MRNGHISEEEITAYALGELEGDERERIGAYVAANPAARKQVDEVRATGRLVAESLAKETTVAPQQANEPPVVRRRVNPFILLTGMAAGFFLIIAGALWLLMPSLRLKTELASDVAHGRANGLPQPQQNNSARVDQSGPPPASMPGAAATPGGGPYGMPGFGMYPGFGMSPGTGGHPGTGSYPGMRGSPGLMPGYPGMMPGYPGVPAGPATEVPPAQGTERYDGVADRGFREVTAHPLSTFSIDVDTASYSNVRRFLTQNMLPPADAVRVEEMINYFPYGYTPPTADAKAPFAAHIEVGPCPWQPRNRLVRIGLKGREINAEQRPPSNLVFLIDVSGSMEPENKLPLVKRGLRMLVERLTENDRVAIVVYAGSTGTALPSTTGDQKATILGAIDGLGAGGSTNGAGGIEAAYQVAVRHFIPKGVNRVILCTDGDFNVGITDPAALVRLIEQKAKTGVFLSILGFGMGNLKDATMEKLADKGNGNYAHVDTLAEARKVLVEQMSGTLVTIAKDVKVQVEFNPAVVSSYRLVGYENRLLAKEDFNDDTKDAGEIGAGHTVTALYEVVPVVPSTPAPGGRPAVDPLKYQKPPPPPATVPADGASGELLTVKLRYKAPEGQSSWMLQFPVTDTGAGAEAASDDYRFAAAVAAFGMLLRDSPHKGSATFDDVLDLAQGAIGRDEGGYRVQFLDLVRKARELKEGR